MSIMSTGGSDLERRTLHVGAVGYTVDEVARMLRISRNAVYDMVAPEEIAAVKVGRLLRIPAKPFHTKFANPGIAHPPDTEEPRDFGPGVFLTIVVANRT